MTDEPDSVDELISRYLDGEATEAEITRVESDPSLLARAESMRAAIEAVAAPVEIPTADLDRIRTMALAESTTTEQVTDLMAAGAARAERLQRRNRVMAIAAAFVLLAVGVVAVRSLPGGDDDDTADSGSDSSSIETSASDDAGDDGDADESGDSFSTFGDESDDDMAEEEAADEDDMADAEMAEEEPTEEDLQDDAGADTADDAAEPLPFARSDVLPDELPPFASTEELVDLVAAEYADQIDLEADVGESVEELLATRCEAALALLLEALPAGIATVEPLTTELEGVPVTVFVAVGFDGSLVIVSHPTDDCDAATVLAIIPPS